jgi:peptidoglycan/xylan/chitin deacetylase (PgdA/CDA1 family)
MTRALALLFHDVYEGDPAQSGFAGAAANRYKLSVREFEAQLASLRRVRPDRPILLTAPLPEYGPLPFIITVDDGGESFYTQVAERLERLGWRAHCFVTTRYIGRPGFLNARQIRDLRRRGHVIGSHSATHPIPFHARGRNELVREWGESREVLSDLLGEPVTVASVPAGDFSRMVARTAREAGLTVLFTSEPETRVRTVEACTVIGRFGVRRGCSDDFAGRVARLDPATRLREWSAWNAKKLMKRTLGTLYPRLTHHGLRGVRLSGTAASTMPEGRE